MEKIDQNKLADLLELVTVLAFFFLVFVIYAPVSIWAEEREFEKRSRFNMQNIYDIEMFYEQMECVTKIGTAIGLPWKNMMDFFKVIHAPLKWPY